MDVQVIDLQADAAEKTGADRRYGPATIGPSVIKNQLGLPAVVGFAYIKSGRT